ncbi:OmpA family protein [Tenacibaculum jejuense]|uniref:OmpA/MotB domain protein n=1 Tax=Tenacibaculum jejuense TaxID=584609 RepID=A0A238UHF0_9FLAO|nr:OmpA family protein [Tenacibaculum jejuense]SNR17710.1 OmpA/MotB domain protein [Tenacibaculum jejuense]
MGRKSFYLLGILLTIIIGTYFSYILCCNSESQDENTTSSEIVATKKVYKEPTLYPFLAKDAISNLSFSSNDNFNFEASNLNFLKPISTNLETEIDKLKDYLTTNDSKSLSITGYYTQDEENKSAYPNLGLARANSIKNFLSSKGVSSKIMNTFGELKQDMIADSLQVYHGPLAFSISELKDNSEEMDKLATYIKEHAIELHFKSGQSEISLNSEERQEIADIAKYLDKVDGATCIITGHTDNTGDVTKNVILGQNRANSVKEYLVKNAAIPANKIIATSKGQSEPIADNSTPEGRAKNRRTIITIK